MGVACRWGISGITAFVLAGLAFSLGAEPVWGKPAEPTQKCASVADVAEQPSGQILVLVDYPNCLNPAPQVFQFDASGHLDTSYGQDGAATPPTGLNVADCCWASYPRRLLLRPGGGAMVVSFNQLVAFRPDGSPDPSFGSDGTVNVSEVAPSAPSGINAAAVQPDGKIVIAGWSADAPVTISRFLPSGELDTAFGAGGTTGIDLPDDPDSIYPFWNGVGDVTSSAGGDVYLGMGLSYGRVFGSADSPAVIRLNEAGELDTSYGANGDGVAVGPPGPASMNDVNIDSMKIKVQDNGSASLFGARAVGLKLLTRGYVANFDENGESDGEPSDFVSIPNVIDSRNRIVGVGNVNAMYSGDDNSFTADRYLTDRSPDTSFGTTGNGVFKAYIGPREARAEQLIELKDGSGYLLAGTALVSRCKDPCRTALAVVKLDESGNLDETFGGNKGVATVPGINCPLGTGARRGPTWVSLHRCRRSGGPFVFGASVRKPGSKRPALGVRVGGLGHPTFTQGDTYDVVENWKVVTVKLPAAIRLRSPKRRNLLTVTRDGGPRLLRKDLAVTKVGRRYRITLKVRGNVEKQAKITIRLKRGAIRLRAKRKRITKLRIKATVEQGGTPNPERISARSTRLRFFKAK